MSKLYITTQVWENYGDIENPYWKPKGGIDYMVLNIDINNAAAAVESVRPQFECNNEFYTEHVLSWEVVADDYLTEFEQSQLDYEGKIRFPATVFSLEVA
jgi:hypothetical protein